MAAISGAAFQIADDLLDAIGTTEEIGKRAGKDAAAGKATLVAIMGAERARAQADMLAAQAAAHLEAFGDGARPAARAGRLRGRAPHLTRDASLRADQSLVERGLVESRARAQALILAGQVFSGERRVDKAGAAAAGGRGAGGARAGPSLGVARRR